MKQATRAKLLVTQIFPFEYYIQYILLVHPVSHSPACSAYHSMQWVTPSVTILTDGTIEADCHKPSDVIPGMREDKEHVENSGTQGRIPGTGSCRLRSWPQGRKQRTSGILRNPFSEDLSALRVSCRQVYSFKTTDYRLQTRPRSLDLIVLRHSQRGMVKGILHKSTWPTFPSTSWIRRNSPNSEGGDWSGEQMEMRRAERWKQS